MVCGLCEEKKNNKPTFLLSSIIISGHFIEWKDHVNILAVESLLFSIFFLAQEIFSCLGTNNLWKIINNKVTFKKAMAHFLLKQTSMLSGFALFKYFWRLQ